MKKTISKALCIILTVIFILPLFTLSTFASSLSLNKKSFNIYEGTSYTLKVNGASSKITWSTSNKTVAVVSKSGKVTAKSEGKCFIYAETDGYKLKSTVNVIKPYLTVSNDSLVFDKPGQQKSFTCNIYAPKKSIGIKLLNGNAVSVKYSYINKSYVKVTVISKSEGTIDIELYLKSDSSVKKTVDVTVKNSDTGNNIAEDTEDTNSADMINEVFEIVNEKRNENGLESYVLDELLCAAADIRAKELGIKFSHTRPNGTICFTAMDEEKCEYISAAENIAAGQRNAEEVMDSWMSSAGHKANILDSNLKKIGIGCYYDNGTYYWVQVFSD